MVTDMVFCFVAGAAGEEPASALKWSDPGQVRLLADAPAEHGAADTGAPVLGGRVCFLFDTTEMEANQLIDLNVFFLSTLQLYFYFLMFLTRCFHFGLLYHWRCVQTSTAAVPPESTDQGTGASRHPEDMKILVVC